MSKNLRQDPSSSVDILLAVLNIPLADVLRLESFSAQIISSSDTSVPAAIDLQMPSSQLQQELRYV